MMYMIYSNIRYLHEYVLKIKTYVFTHYFTSYIILKHIFTNMANAHYLNNPSNSTKKKSSENPVTDFVTGFLPYS